MKVGDALVENIVEVWRVSCMNDNGEKLVKGCEERKLAMGIRISGGKEIHKYNMVGEISGDNSLTDYVLVGKAFKEWLFHAKETEIYVRRLIKR